MKCAICKAHFEKKQAFQKWCSADCAIKLINKKKEKEKKEIEEKEKRILKEKKLNVKPLSYFIKAAQVEFNRYIRVRDSLDPCISCGRFHNGQYHAGHFRTVGANPELRFNEDNCHKQCSVCNNYMSGNLNKYRENLINKIGLERYEKLIKNHEPKKYTREQLEHIRKLYREKTKDIVKSFELNSAERS